MEGHSFERLKSQILPLSASQSFNVARTEWSLVAVENSEEFDQCPCGQDIKEHSYIRKRLNGNQTYVGNVCINRFIQIDTGKPLRRPEADRQRPHRQCEQRPDRARLSYGLSLLVRK